MINHARALLTYIRDNNRELFDEIEWCLSLDQALATIAEHYNIDPPKLTDEISAASDRMLSEIQAQEDDLR